MKIKKIHVVVAATLASSFQLANAEERIQLAWHDHTIYANEVLVTAIPMSEPSVVETDPRITRQPLPAHDGADYLKTIPGFSVMRKGGTDGEAVLRGMAGSRLNILVDGENVLGGCSMRMDSPTAYIFPEAYDKLTVVKGPQTVLFGPGGSAGSVMFERGIKFLKEPGYQGRGSLLIGGFGRHDEILDVKAGNQSFYVQGTGTNSQSGDYEDGKGVKVHSKYHRYSSNLAAGFAIDENTKLELSGAYSDGWASYADRGMDGSQFKRENLAFRFEKNKISTLVDKVSFQISRNDIDHIMDDFTLRTPGMMAMGWARLKHETINTKLKVDLIPSHQSVLSLGIDAQQSNHEKASGARSVSTDTPTSADAEFQQIGLFGEGRYLFDDTQRLIAGYRADFWDAKDKRATGTTPGASRNETLHSGFVRYEKELSIAPLTSYVGFGHTERFPDYWELISAHSAGTSDTNSAFLSTKPEKTNQVDIGFLSKVDKLTLNGSVFYNQINDFILIDYRTGFASMMGYGSARNINAHTYGAEFDATYKINDELKANGSLAYVRGRNETDHVDLAQLAPLEARFGLTYDNKTWFAGGLLRVVDNQNHYSVGQGNIAGKDIGPNAGFATVSLNAGWRPTANSLISAGVDNLFDKTYAEFISRSGSAISGYAQTTRINEPGRMLWIKGTLNF
jgi:iron complex outermembrane receptor protein